MSRLGKYKVIFIGDPNVGKTSILQTYNSQQFSSQTLATLGLDTMVLRRKKTQYDQQEKEIRIENQNFILDLWDTAGADQFRALTRSFYKGSDVVVIVYDATSMDSFQNAERMWIRDMEDNLDNENAIKILLGNKSDQKKVVQPALGEALSRLNNMTFVEVSATDKDMINNLFQNLIGQKLITYKKNQIQQQQYLQNFNNQQKEKAGCC